MTCCRNVITGLLIVALGGCAGWGLPWTPILPEQLEIEFRDPAELPHARIPQTDPPPTVSQPLPLDVPEWRLTLDEAIRTAIEHSEVVRVLTGVSASSSGSTIYDAAIANAAIDEQQGRFDPKLDAFNNFNRNETPSGVFDPTVPEGASIAGSRADDYLFNLETSQTNIAGGTASLGVNVNPLRVRPGLFPLNPQTPSSVELSYQQPLLLGAGVAANVAPIVLARIDAERSFFQFKDSVQELVRGVIDAYWSLVFARADVWAREQQVEQGLEAYNRERARRARDLANLADEAQAESAWANFRANLIAARANRLRREAALRNILGLPPNDPRNLIPLTPPTAQQITFNWNELLRLAEERRPDLIELKLIIEADEQQLLLSRNQALPGLDAVALYRWNGLEGRTPSRARIHAGGSEFTDWTLGINFSVPLGLRAGRAAARRSEIVLMRDKANLEQGVHNMIHILAGNVRDLDEFYAQYEALQLARQAARRNLNAQVARNRAGLTILLNVLQAITTWGNAVSAEAQALAQYNTELANLERQTGTILETHAIRFYEEHQKFAGPLLRHDLNYPAGIFPGENEDRYPSGDRPAEESFDLSDPLEKSRERRRRDRLPVRPSPQP